MNSHNLLEIRKAFGLTSKPNEAGEVHMVCFLYYSLCIVRNVVVNCFGQVIGKLLEDRAHSIKAE